MELISLQGEQIRPYLNDLAQLRIRIFYDFPYLYDGDAEYEEKYLKTYMMSPQSQVTLAVDNSSVVGATTCIPILDEVDELIEPLKKIEIDLSRTMYFGESILMDSYRGQGIGKKFFHVREQHAHKVFPDLHATLFCSVQREPDHPLRPVDYAPLDDFWKSMGYVKHDQLLASLKWKDRDQSHSTPKQLTYWIKQWQ
jgi:GNAT superfamily N-acetyltransferase